MKKLIGLVLYAGVMFGITAGLGMYMLKKSASHSTIADSGEADVDPAAGTEAHSAGMDSPERHQELSGSEGHAAAVSSRIQGDHASERRLPVRTAQADEQLPVAVRSSPMSVEEIVRMGLSLKSRDETVRRREATLKSMEAQQRLSLADIRTEQQEIENLLAQATDQRAATEEMLVRLKDQEGKLELEREALAQEKQSLTAERAQMETARTEFDATRQSVKAAGDELALKRKEHDLMVEAFNKDREQYVKDLEKFNKLRETIVADREANATEGRRLEGLKSQLDEERKKLDADQKEFAAIGGRSSTEAAAAVSEADRLKNLKDTTVLLSGMEPETAAKLLSRMVEENKADLALDVLRSLEPRKAGAIMDAIQDEKLAADLLLQMNNRNTETKAAGK